MQNPLPAPLLQQVLAPGRGCGTPGAPADRCGFLCCRAGPTQPTSGHAQEVGTETGDRTQKTLRTHWPPAQRAPHAHARRMRTPDAPNARLHCPHTNPTRELPKRRELHTCAFAARTAPHAVRARLRRVPAKCTKRKRSQVSGIAPMKAALAVGPSSRQSHLWRLLLLPVAAGDTSRMFYRHDCEGQWINHHHRSNSVEFSPNLVESGQL